MTRRAPLPVHGFLAALAAVAVLSIMDAVMKHLVLVIGIFAVSVWRAFANFMVAAALYLPRGLPPPDRGTLRIHVLRSVVVTIMAFLFFWGIGRVPLAQAIALTFIAPLIAMLLAVPLLGETLGKARSQDRSRHSPECWSSSSGRAARRAAMQCCWVRPRSWARRFAMRSTSS